MMFQSTRPCGARPQAAIVLCDEILVSIHAPVRGATIEKSGKGRITYVSIHAPVRGATLELQEEGVKIPVSIHAPVRGATAVPAG